MRKIFYSLTLCLFGLYLGGCSDDPTSLGKNFFTGQGLKLDSLILVGSKDTAIAESYYSPTVHYGVQYILVGRSVTDNLEAWSLVNFTPTWDNYNNLIRNGTFPIDSAQLIVNPLYKYGDSTQALTISGYSMNNSWYYSTITVDTTISYDPNPVFTGTLSDTVTTIPITRKDVVLKWLQASLDTNPIGYSYGMVIKPSSSVTNYIAGLEGLSSTATTPPTLKIFTHSGSTLDSASFSVNMNTHLVYPDRHDSVSGLILQSGVASDGLLRFNLNQIPKNVIINAAYLYLYQDTLNSKYGYVGGQAYTSTIYGYADSVGAATPRTVDYNYYSTFTSSAGVQSANVTSVINRFYLLNSEARIILRASYYQDGVEKYLFYDPSNTDRSKRPLLKIYYTKRANQ